MTAYHDVIRQHCCAVAPRATGVNPQLREIPGLRAVLFDIYGTLFVSGCGDVGTVAGLDMQSAAASALAAVGLTSASDHDVAEVLRETIARHHADRRAEGIEHPEVDILDVWSETLCTIGLLPSTWAATWDPRRLAIEYECRVNPVWPMPHLLETLEGLRGLKLTLGLISNAQFFTPELFSALLGETAESIGFDEQLQYYSYRHLRAKPDVWLFQQARESLASRRIEKDEVLYVGNDMLNDVWAASRSGFRTALFAGDARSLRRRETDPRLQGVRPDVVITDLVQLLKIIG